MTHGIETEGSLTGMSVFHEVTGLTSARGGRGDFPVTVGFNHITDVADGSAEVCNSKTATCFAFSEALTGRKIVDHTSLLSHSWHISTIP